jgi:hypothetical protein
MSKSLNDVLAELGYATEDIKDTYQKKILKDGQLIGSMSAGQVWNFLRHGHPEYFEKEGR